MSEKSRLPFPSRFLFCVVTISMFLLILSSLSLLQFGNTSFLSKSVLKLIFVNSTSVYLRPNVKFPFFSYLSSESDLKSVGKSGEGTCLKSKLGTMITCNSNQSMLRVYMYDLPPEFHFGLLEWKPKPNQIWPNVSNLDRIPPYPGGLNLQHSMEYWLTLDLLASNAKVVRPCSAIRVENSSLADIIFVPFFSSLSYNRHSKLRGKQNVSVDRMLQSKLVQFLMDQDEWRKSGGKDHLIIAHHPNSMLYAREKLGSAMFVLADFGRYPAQIANVEKDIIAPYLHIVRSIPSSESSARFHQRPTLVYFQGAIYRKDGGVIRQELYYLIKDEKGVHFTFGTASRNGVNAASQGMATSKFCLNIAGDTPSSNRLFDAIMSHCVPVIISDDIELPFEDVLDYSDFCVFVHSSDALKKGYLLNLLRGIQPDKWTKMWEKLKEIAPHFEYNYPSQPGDAVDMIWDAVYRKIYAVRLKLNRENRYRRSELIIKN